MEYRRILQLFMQLYVLYFESVVQATVIEKWKCFNLQVKCTPTNPNQKCTPLDYVYNFEAIPISVNVNINCESDEIIQITRIDYFLPALDTNSKPYYCPDRETCASVSYGACVCCTRSGPVNSMCIEAASKELGSKCEGKHGTCLFPVPRHTFTSSTCPLAFKGSNCGEGADICHSRWVRVQYECMSISTTAPSAVITPSHPDEISDTDSGNSTIFGSSAISSQQVIGLAVGLTVAALILGFGVILILFLVINYRKSHNSKAKNKNEPHTNVAFNTYSEREVPNTHNGATSNSMQEHTNYEGDQGCAADVPEIYSAVNFDEKLHNKNKKKIGGEIGMVENHYYESEVSKQSGENGMVENNYYDGNNLSGNDQNTTNLHKAPSCELTENHYYESEAAGNIPQSSVKKAENVYAPVVEKKPNKFHNKGQRDGQQEQYAYTYGHFQLEGRKRNPKH